MGVVETDTEQRDTRLTIICHHRSRDRTRAGEACGIWRGKVIPISVQRELLRWTKVGVKNCLRFKTLPDFLFADSERDFVEQLQKSLGP